VHIFISKMPISSPILFLTS